MPPAGRDTDRLLPPDVGRLRVLEQWCRLLLGLIREKTAELETRERLAEAARSGPIRVPETGWLIEQGIGTRRSAVLVHLAGCGLASGRTRPATRAQAHEVPRHPAADTCQVCGADRELGVADP
ncbi:DUF6233 domain-containing protein [Streptomyces sp. NPDC007369]|uniref:DUF6233 domain-containing protein n=1 Tax=Streptomyces sp. NPDC007369 TaxID=3154589 RepID=UPI0034020640